MNSLPVAARVKEAAEARERMQERRNRPGFEGRCARRYLRSAGVHESGNLRGNQIGKGSGTEKGKEIDGEMERV